MNWTMWSITTGVTGHICSRHRTRTGLAVLAAIFLLAACSEDSRSDSNPESQPSIPKPVLSPETTSRRLVVDIPGTSSTSPAYKSHLKLEMDPPR